MFLFLLKLFGKSKEKSLIERYFKKELKSNTASSKMLKAFLKNMGKSSTTSVADILLKEDKELIVKTFEKDSSFRTSVTYKPNGEVVYKRIFKAAQYSYCRFGSKLLIQLANADLEEGGFLYFIEMKTGEEIFKVKPEFDWQKEFKYQDDVLSVVTDMGEFELDNDGNLKDRLSYLKTALKYPRYSYRLIESVHKLLEIGENSPRDIERYREALDSIVTSSETGDDYKSRALRLKGKLYESQDDLNNAYYSYLLALKLNPKVGVKAKINKLDKKLDEKIKNDIIRRAESFF